jgi:ribonuclease P protein component
MLPRHLRLRRSQDFAAIRRHGRHWREDLLILGVLPNRLPYSRVGLVVSRRIGKAAARNLVRRRLREVVRRWLPRMQKGYDAVIVARSAASEATYHELEAGLGKLLRHACLVVDEEEH